MSEPQETGYDYLRVRIEAKLRLKSPLHCGDGAELAVADWHCGQPLGSQGHINTVCVGHRGAYIPGSTLRGSLRERCADPARLFGEARGDAGQAGALRVYDAVRPDPDPAPAKPPAPFPGPPGDLYWNPTRGTTLKHGVALDPITGTAAEGKLFTFEVVPPDQVFDCVFEADRLTKAELTLLLALIRGWDGSAATALGRGRGKGWGQVEFVDHLQVKVLADDQVAAWVKEVSALTPGQLRHWADDKPQARPTKAPPKGPPIPRHLMVPKPAVAVSTSHGQTFQFHLTADSPLLVNDAGRERRCGRFSPADFEPHLMYMRTAKGAALIPGSSLRGAVRAQARRILATIDHRHQKVAATAAGKHIEPLLHQLFGTERRRGLLWIGDAVAQETGDHCQTFSAIDRFTGAVAQEAQTIYSVAAADCATLSGSAVLDLDRRRLPAGDWWKGLLLLLLRDLYEGDLILGWGKSRGYGALRLTLELPATGVLADFATLLTEVRQRCNDNEAPGRWLAALHDQIGALPPTDTTREVP